MRTIVKRVVVLLIVIATVFAMAGCNKKNPVVVITWDPNSYSPEVKGEIVVSYEPGATSEKQQLALNSMITAFEREYAGTQVKADFSAGDKDSKIATGDIGDVFYLIDEHVYRYASEEKVLLDLDPYAQALSIDTQNVYSGILKMGMVNGKLYMAARDYNQIALIYNVEAVREAGLENDVKPDWTWGSFLSICEQLTKSTDDDAEIDQHGAQFDMSYDPIYIPFLEAYAGKDMWCDTELKKITFVDEEGLVLKAVIELVNAARAGYVSVTGTSEIKGSPVFTTLVYPGVQSSVTSRFSGGVEWDLINIPLFESPSIGAGCSGFAVYNRTTNPDTAAAFTLFFFTEEGQEAYNSQVGGSVPLLNSMRESTFWQYPDGGPNGEAEWADKNWDAFVAYASTASTNGQIECRMPAEVASVIAGSFGSIIQRTVNSGNTQNLIDQFTVLQEKCNETWDALID